VLVFVCFLKVISGQSLHHVRQTAVSNLCSRTSSRLSQHQKFFVVYLGNEMSLTVYLSIIYSFFVWGSQRKRLVYVDAIFVSVVAPMLYTLSLLTRFIPIKPTAVTQFPFSTNGCGVLYPPVTDCKMVYRLSNTPPALRFRHWKFITEDETFYVIFIFSSVFVF